MTKSGFALSVLSQSLHQEDMELELVLVQALVLA
jgi:hypothetical protein